ncbi:hypothetical protein C8Q73DRAFT_688738 [Cubamyces lactineus]|nr:hypothetical protein C8Q73DRAFT_688738 [Cubamyces lactineus]
MRWAPKGFLHKNYSEYGPSITTLLVLWQTGMLAFKRVELYKAARTVRQSKRDAQSKQNAGMPPKLRRGDLKKREGRPAEAHSVGACDTATSDVFWTGNLLDEAFENTEKLFTNGTATYCTTQ